MTSPKYSGKPRRHKFILVRKVVGNSMLPTLRPEQIVFATGLYRDIRPGQIVIFRHGDLEKIKRVKKVEGNKLFVEGDNKAESKDSNVFGWISSDKVFARLLRFKIRKQDEGSVLP